MNTNINPEEKTHSYVAIFGTSKGYFLLLNNEDDFFMIQAWQSLKDAKNYFELGYNNSHARNYESSMSACPNFIQFNPRIAEFNSLVDMITKLGLKNNTKPLRFRSASGSYDVMKLDETLAKPVYETAIEPALISYDEQGSLKT
jgi:hypothetical protein